MFPLTAWVGRSIPVPPGRRRAKVTDVVVDLSDRRGVVEGLIVAVAGRTGHVPWGAVRFDLDTGRLLSVARSPGDPEEAPTTLRLVRDLLDTQIYDVAAHRTSRVSEVWLEPAVAEVHVAGLEIGPSALRHRLLPGRRHRKPPGQDCVVPMSAVHLLSAAGKRAQLATDLVGPQRLDDDALAHLLTHLPAQAAADAARLLPKHRLHRVSDRLHPRVREKLQHALREGPAPRPPRTRRTDGWRTYPPTDTQEEPR